LTGDIGQSHSAANQSRDHRAFIASALSEIGAEELSLILDE